MKKIIYLVIGLLIGIMALAINYTTSIFESFELMIYNNMFKLRDGASGKDTDAFIQANPDLDPDIYIIGVDEITLHDLGQWPFSNRIHARFLEYLAGGGPEMIFMDILFLEPTVKIDFEIDKDGVHITKNIQSGDDAALEAALETARTAGVKVYLPFPADIKSTMENIDTAQLTERIACIEENGFFYPGPVNNAISFNYIKPPLPGLITRSRNIGFIAARADRDATYRSLLLLGAYDGRVHTHLVLRMLQDYFRVGQQELIFSVSGSALTFKGALVPGYDETGMKTGSHEADIEVPLIRQNQMLINFAGQPGEFLNQGQYISYSDVFTIDPSFFAGKYLFVGAYAQGIHDIWVSPYGPMYGIEFNANSFNTVIKKNFLNTVPVAVNILIVLLLSILVAFLSSILRTWQASLAFAAVIVIYLFSAYFLFTGRVIVLYWTPLFAVFLAFAAAVVYRILVEEREKRFIKGRFDNYVSPHVVDELLKNPKMLNLGGEDRELTVFFSDIRSFTTISESLSPQELVNLLNSYLSSMTNIIIENNGTLDKYIGDAIMAFWGAPLHEADHALSACRAACLQMRYLFWILHPLLIKGSQPSINIGCGINTGIMTVGNMGSKSRMDYTVMGDHVNLGSRLEGVNKIYGTNILISEYTYKLVQDKIIARELDNITVTGKQQSILIYELLGIKGEEESFYLKQPGQLIWEESASKTPADNTPLPELPPAVSAYMQQKGIVF